MRISDWSSDVCSSDLVTAPHNNQPFDPERAYSVPYMWGTTGFTYDSAKVGELEESWKEIFEPGDALKNQIAMLNDETEVYNAAAYYVGVNKCTEDSKDAQKILDVLEIGRASCRERVCQYV